LIFIYEVNAQYIEFQKRIGKSTLYIVPYDYQGTPRTANRGTPKTIYYTEYFYRIIGEKQGFRKLHNGKELIPYIKLNEEAYNHLKKYRRSVFKPSFLFLVAMGAGNKANIKREKHLIKAIEVYNEDYLLQYHLYKIDVELNNINEFENVDLLMYKTLYIDTINNNLIINAIVPINEKVVCSLSRKGKKRVSKTISSDRNVQFKFDLASLKTGRYHMILKSKNLYKTYKIYVKKPPRT